MNRYYIVNGLQPWTKADEKKLNKRVAKGYVGNVVEKLISQGYVLDEQRMGLYAPDGHKVCSVCSVF